MWRRFRDNISLHNINNKCVKYRCKMHRAKRPKISNRQVQKSSSKKSVRNLHKFCNDAPPPKH